MSDDQRKRLASPHNADRVPGRNWGFDALAGVGAIRSTTRDMLRFIQANLDPRASPLGKAIELAWKQHLPAKGQAFAMGLGWHIARDEQTRWHNGQTGENLFVKATLQLEFHVYAESETKWKYRVVDASLTFELPKSGNSSAVTLHQSGRDMRAPRIGD